MTMKSPANYLLQSGLAPQGQQVSANPLHPAHGNPHLLPAEFSQHSWGFFPVTSFPVCLACTKQHQASAFFAQVDTCFMSVPDSLWTQIPKTEGFEWPGLGAAGRTCLSFHNTLAECFMSAHMEWLRCGRVPGLTDPSRAVMGVGYQAQLPGSNITGMSRVVCPPWLQCCRAKASVTLNCSSSKWALPSA